MESSIGRAPPITFPDPRVSSQNGDGKSPQNGMQAIHTGVQPVKASTRECSSFVQISYGRDN